MEDSAPFEIHNKLLSDLITEYLDSSVKSDRERNFTKWKLAFRSIKDSPFHRDCPILWDFFFLEDTKRIGIGEYNVLRRLMTDIGHAGDRIGQAENLIRESSKCSRGKQLDYPIVLKSRAHDLFYGDNVIIEADGLRRPELDWWKIKESERLPKKLDLRMAKYSESTCEGNQSTLILKDVTFEDAGLYYICNKTGKRQSNQLHLKIKGELPGVYVRTSSSNIQLGYNFEMRCHVVSIPPAKSASWWKFSEERREEINTNCDKYAESSSDPQKEPVLKINRLDYEDEGTYYLRVTNAVGQAESKHCGVKFDEDNSTRTIRYFHLIQLGGKSLIHFVERKINSSLKTYLAEKDEELGFLLTKSQMEQIKTIQSPESLDISVLYIILKSMPDIQSPTKGWGNLPGDNDILPSDDVERIQIHYEFMIQQMDSHTMSSSLFKEKWSHLSQAIQRLSTFVQERQIDDIYFSELDQSALKKSLKSIKDNTERDLKSQSEKKILPVIEIQGPELVRYHKTAEITGTIKSPNEILHAAWKKESRNIDISTPKYRGSIDNGTDAKLIIKKMDTDDVANYNLIVKNESGMTRSNAIYLRIKEGKPKCEILGEACRMVSIGGSETLQGKVKSYPKPVTLQWIKIRTSADIKLDIKSHKYQGSKDHLRKPTLMINNIDLNDYGIYILNVKNIKGTANSKEIKLDIEEEGIGDFSNQDKLMDYLSMYEKLGQNVELSNYPEIQEIVVKTDRLLENWKNETDSCQREDVLKKYFYIVCKMMTTYNITKGRCSRGSINIELEFPNRGSFLKFEKDVKEGDMKGNLEDILLFQPLMQNLDLSVEPNDFFVGFGDVQEKQSTKDIDLIRLPESDVFAAAIDLGNTYSSYVFSEMISTKTTASLIKKKHGHLEKIPTVLLLDKDLQIHSFGHKPREEYTHLRGQKEAENLFYFENFMTLIYETSTKSVDRNIQIPDAQGRNVSAKIIISRCASYMIERAIRHIREEFAHVLLSSFKFVFTLPTFWSLADGFFKDALSEVNNALHSIITRIS
ncbi:uncharacterized protein LOC134267884 [Saccostrea cucullata]|uniref:uncharacterized protein LOC134267884 n=1 Tax=Saccostrea cuccullata TaxID=36930 RepID=UPI002ED06F9C